MSTAAPTAPIAAAAARLASGSTPAPASAAAISAPPSAPKENAACSELKIRRGWARSTAIPCAFIAMSSTPLAAPARSAAPNSVGRLVASAGRTSAQR